MNYVWQYPGFTEQQERMMVVYLNTTHKYKGNNYYMVITNRMTLENIEFYPRLVTKTNRKINLLFEIVAQRGTEDPYIGQIYITQDGYWDYELYYTLFEPGEEFDPNSTYLVEKGSIFFYRGPNNPYYEKQDPEVVYMSPDYEMNDTFTASVLNTNPVVP